MFGFSLVIWFWFIGSVLVMFFCVTKLISHTDYEVLSNLILFHLVKYISRFINTVQCPRSIFYQLIFIVQSVCGILLKQ